jgi:hypothetical protein
MIGEFAVAGCRESARTPGKEISDEHVLTLKSPMVAAEGNGS